MLIIVCILLFLGPIAEFLIESGADINMQHGNGGTALMFASLFGRNEVLRILLKHGADKEIKEQRGLTALDLAVQQGNVEAAMLLQEESSILSGEKAS